jgi:hypothetical protein
MGRFRIGIITAAAVLCGAALVGCGSNNNKSNNSAAAANATASAQIKTLSGVSTTVDLDPGTLKVLADNKVMVAPVAPAKLVQDPGTPVAGGSGVHAVFPITGGNVSIYPETALPFIRGSVTHSGGLTFSAGSASLTATDFIIDPGASTLTATVGGQQVRLFDLDGHNVKVSKDAQGMVHLDGTVVELSQPAADALNKTFNVTLFKQGIVIGIAHIVAAGS